MAKQGIVSKFFLKKNVNCFRLIFLFLASFHTFTAFANVGQPGIWKTGGGISLLVPEDSLAMDIIAMESEKVDILLYSGFAVVHGQYSLVNMGDSAVEFTMGYPLASLWKNAVYPEGENPFGYSFRVDSLAHFELFVDGKGVQGLNHKGVSDWITWTIRFEPGQRRMIEVTYLTPTESSKVTTMHGVREGNGLMYIFESGAAWKGTIKEARLNIHLQDGLSEEEIIGIRPCGEVYSSQNSGILSLRKQNWEPGLGENFYLIYTKRENKYYSFGEAVEDKKILYQRIREQAQTELPLSHMTKMPCKDILEVDTNALYKDVLIKVFGGLLLVLLLIITLVVFWFKKRSA
jgi:hypothetical protein